MYWKHVMGSLLLILWREFPSWATRRQSIERRLILPNLDRVKELAIFGISPILLPVCNQCEVQKMEQKREERIFARTESPHGRRQAAPWRNSFSTATGKMVRGTRASPNISRPWNQNTPEAQKATTRMAER